MSCAPLIIASPGGLSEVHRLPIGSVLAVDENWSVPVGKSGNGPFLGLRGRFVSEMGQAAATPRRGRGAGHPDHPV